MPEIIDSKWPLFIKVTELGSVTHAAAAMDVPQSVISRQIGILERECGGRLFRRTGRGVTLSEFGQQIYPRIKGLVSMADQLSDDIRTASGEPIGTVHLGVLPSSISHFVGQLLQISAQKYPKVQLHFTEGSSVQLEDWLNQGRLDLSLLVRENDAATLDEPTMREVALSLIGPPGDPLTSKPQVDFDQLANIPLVLPAEPHLLRAHLNAIARKRNIQLKVQVEADSMHLQEEIVAAGGGYAILAARMLNAGEAARFSNACIVNPKVMRRIVLSTTLLRQHTLAIRSIKQLVLELGAEHFPSL